MRDSTQKVLHLFRGEGIYSWATGDTAYANPSVALPDWMLGAYDIADWLGIFYVVIFFQSHFNYFPDRNLLTCFSQNHNRIIWIIIYWYSISIENTFQTEVLINDIHKTDINPAQIILNDDNILHEIAFIIPFNLLKVLIFISIFQNRSKSFSKNWIIFRRTNIFNEATWEDYNFQVWRSWK